MQSETPGLSNRSLKGNDDPLPATSSQSQCPALPDDSGLRDEHGKHTETIARGVMPQEGDQAGSGQVFWGPVGPHKFSSVSRTAVSDKTAGQGHFLNVEDLALLQNRVRGRKPPGGFDSLRLRYEIGVLTWVSR